jgi:hypothetical protein
MIFTIYSDSLGTSADWTETQTDVVVKEGIFSVILGSVDSIPGSVFDGSTKYLGVQVESDPEMRPLKPMVSTGYAFRSQEADTAEYARVSMPDADWVIDGDNIYHLNGNVGIGTTAPRDKLHIKFGSSGTSHFILDGAIFESNTNGWWAIYCPNNGAGGLMVADSEDFDEARLYYYHVDNSWRIDGNGTREMVRINSSGNFGINTTSPTAKLDINGLTGYNQVRMRSSFTPTNTADTLGNIGDIAWDDTYFYVKTSAGWKRVALSTW